MLYSNTSSKRGCQPLHTHAEPTTQSLEIGGEEGELAHMECCAAKEQEAVVEEAVEAVVKEAEVEETQALLDSWKKSFLALERPLHSAMLLMTHGWRRDELRPQGRAVRGTSAQGELLMQSKVVAAPSSDSTFQVWGFSVSAPAPAPAAPVSVSQPQIWRTTGEGMRHRVVDACLWLDWLTRFFFSAASARMEPRQEAMVQSFNTAAQRAVMWPLMHGAPYSSNSLSLCVFWVARRCRSNVTGSLQ